MGPIAALLCAAALLGAGDPAGAATGDPAAPKVRWRSKDHPLDRLPDEMPAAAQAAILTWSSWAEEGGYRLDLEHGGSVLLVTPKKGGRWRSQMRLIDRTVKTFEDALPLPERDPADELPPPSDDGGGLPEDPSDGPLPEDPEGDGPVEPGDLGTTSWSWTKVWGTEGVPLDTETIVLFVVRDERDYKGLLEVLVDWHSYLTPWAEEAGGYTGFTLERPLAGAYIESASGMEEWNPDNEVVNRTAHLLLVRRFGQLPFWLSQGWSWYVEMKLLKAIYCFPYRNEFVWATEHTDWDKELAKTFGPRRGEPLRIGEVADWRRGAYDAAFARPAWGVVEFLRRHHPGALVRIAEDLRLHRAVNNRLDTGRGNWERELDYDVPPEAQAEILERHAGPDFLLEVAEFFRLGSRYRGGSR
ncbi:MAG: hypothetical protein AAF682_23565 [Planctomycetota bacterium]